MDKRSKLIENVARRIIDAINDRFPQIKYTELSLSKINPPITGQVGKATVRLISER
jgi:dihydroneopterin aldolase